MCNFVVPLQEQRVKRKAKADTSVREVDKWLSILNPYSTCTNCTVLHLNGSSTNWFTGLMVPQIPGMPKLVLFFYSKCGGDNRLKWLSLPISLDLVPQFCGNAHKCKTIRESALKWTDRIGEKGRLALYLGLCISSINLLWSPDPRYSFSR